MEFGGRFPVPVGEPTLAPLVTGWCSEIPEIKWEIDSGLVTSGNVLA